MDKARDILELKAYIFDLDGVITRTARVHFAAWKKMFDDYLKRHSEKKKIPFQPFEKEDYARYVDGKPRYDGVQSFLVSRGVNLPFGGPEDSPEEETVCGLGNRKNRLFQDFLKRKEVEVFDDAVEFIKNRRRENKAVAVVSSSKNCRKVLEAAEIEHLFDIRVDGITSVEQNLAGKPAPDIFVYAARQLKVGPSDAAVFEDAPAGVKAGRDGRFGRVIGIARNGEEVALMESGADRVIRSFKEIDS